MNQYFKNFTLPIFCLITALPVIFSGCQNTWEQEAIEPNQELTFTSNDRNQIYENVKDFSSLLNHYPEAELKAGNDSITTDSALLLIEATLNYNHSFPWCEKHEVDFVSDSYDSIFYKLNNKLSIQRVAELYYHLKNIVIVAYENSTFDNIKLLGVDLAFKEFPSGGYNIEVLSVLTSIPPGPIAWEPPYDDWKYGYELGYCDENIPPSSLDAGKVLTSAINASLNPATQTRKWYNYNSVTETFNYLEYRNEYDDEGFDNYQDYYIFYAIEEGEGPNKLHIGIPEICVNKYEMNFYKNNTQRIFVEYLETLPPEYYFEFCLIEGQEVIPNPEIPVIYYINHYTRATYSFEIERELNDLPNDIK